MRKPERERQCEWVEANVFDIGHAMKYLGISRQGLYQAIDYGRIERTANGFFLKADLDELKPKLKANRK